MILIYAKLWISPEILVVASVHKTKLSPTISSTCVVFLLGPTTLTHEILHFAQTKVTVSCAANSPG